MVKNRQQSWEGKREMQSQGQGNGGGIKSRRQGESNTCAWKRDGLACPTPPVWCPQGAGDTTRTEAMSCYSLQSQDAAQYLGYSRYWLRHWTRARKTPTLMEKSSLILWLE